MSNGPLQESKKFIIPNELGLHARTATRLVKTANMFKADIEIMSEDNRRANAKSVLDLLTLGAEQGQSLSITTKGADAREAMVAIVELFENNLGD